MIQKPFIGAAAIFQAAEKVLRCEQDCPDWEHEGHIAYKHQITAFTRSFAPFH